MTEADLIMANIQNRPPSVLLAESNGSPLPAVLVPDPLSPTYPSKEPMLHDPTAWTSTDLLSANVSHDQQAMDVLADMLAKCSNSGLNMNTAMDLETWRGEIQGMSATKLSNMASRLKELFEVDSNGPDDGQREAEGSRWMLWALDHLDPIPSVDYSSKNGFSDSGGEVERILMLNEPQGAFRLNLNDCHIL